MPAADPAHREHKLRQACTELERRLRDGADVGAESFLDVDAELSGDEESALELIYTEFLAREELGKQRPLADWLDRFPRWRQRLERQLKVHDLIKDASDAAEPLQRIGRYEIETELGRGGMGVVYRARDVTLGRAVALKLIRPTAFLDAAARERFRREAATVALLQHPHIVQIYEAGVSGDQPFLALEYVAGGSLAAHVGEPWSGPYQPLAELMRTLALAVHHAHQRGVVHCDLKPANILLQIAEPLRIADCGSRIEESNPPQTSLQSAIRNPQSGIPKIVDFGLAKQLGSSGQVPRTVVGTPAYMAPEQAEGDLEHVGTPADVYALGAILYELLTGQPPFAGTSSLETLERVVREEPAPPRRRSPSVPSDLEAICLKCLTKDPAGRYASAAALADDLQRYLAGEPIQARQVGPIERAGKWARRRPALAALVLLSLATIAALFAGSLWYNARLRDELEVSRRGQYNLQLASVGATWERDPTQALQLLEDPERCPADLRDFTWRWLRRLADRETLSLTHDQGVHALAFAADGKVLATADGPRFPGEAPAASTVRLWDVASGQRLAALPSIPGKVNDLVFLPGGQELVVVGGRQLESKVQVGFGQVWSLAERKPTRALSGPAKQLNAIALSPSGLLVAGGDEPKLFSWDFTGQPRPTIDIGHSVAALAFAPEGGTIAVAGGPIIDLWDGASGRMLARLPRHEGPVRALAWSADGQRLASGGHDRQVILWDAARQEVRAVLRGHGNTIRAVAFSPDAATLATGGDDFWIRLWDAGTGQEIGSLRGHDREITALAWSPDGRHLASASADRLVKVWRTAHPQLRLEGHTGRVTCAAWSPDGRWLVSGGADARLCLWDGNPDQPLAVQSGHRRAVRAVAFAPDSSWLASAGEDQRIVLWNLPELKPRAELLGHEHMVTALAVSPDGRRLVSAGLDATTRIWDVATAQEVGRLVGHSGDVKCVTITPDGRVFLTGGEDGTIRLWDAVSFAPVAVLTGHEGRVASLAVSPDGRTLASGGNDRTVRLWDLGRREPRAVLTGHTHWINAAVFSPDGRTLVTATGDRHPNVPGELKFWDPVTGQLRATFTGQAAPLAFAADGEALAVGGNDNALRVWKLRP